MYKIFLTLIFGALLNAELVNGIALVVKGEAVTLYDLKEEMRITGFDANRATDNLIRKKLEESEIIERKISVTSADVYEDIKKTAAQNNMSVSAFYEAVRNSKGLSSTELKEKTKEKLLTQRLYSSIAYSSVSEPSDDEVKEYYELHKEEFTHPSAFKVIIYSSHDKEKLQKKISSPMFFSVDVKADEQRLPYDRISPELAQFLQKARPSSFTPIIPDGKGSFMSFYLKETESALGYEAIKDRVANSLMGSKREQVLSDYFARLRGNADIQVLREVK